MPADREPADMTNEELAAWAMDIFLRHEHDQAKQVGALFDALQDQPISVLVRLTEKDSIVSLLNNYFLSQQAPPGPPTDLKL